MYQTRSTFGRVSSLLNLLTSQGLLEKGLKEGILVYKITTKGKELLRAIELVFSSLGSTEMQLDSVSE